MNANKTKILIRVHSRSFAFIRGPIGFLVTVQTALQQGTELLGDERISAPRLTAEVLLSHALHRDRIYLYSHPEHELTEIEWLHYGRYLHQRLNGRPTQYIT